MSKTFMGIKAGSKLIVRRVYRFHKQTTNKTNNANLKPSVQRVTRLFTCLCTSMARQKTEARSSHTSSARMMEKSGSFVGFTCNEGVDLIPGRVSKSCHHVIYENLRKCWTNEPVTRNTGTNLLNCRNLTKLFLFYMFQSLLEAKMLQPTHLLCSLGVPDYIAALKAASCDKRVMAEQVKKVPEALSQISYIASFTKNKSYTSLPTVRYLGLPNFLMHTASSSLSPLSNPLTPGSTWGGGTVKKQAIITSYFFYQ